MLSRHGQGRQKRKHLPCHHRASSTCTRASKTKRYRRCLAAHQHVTHELPAPPARLNHHACATPELQPSRQQRSSNINICAVSAATVRQPCRAQGPDSQGIRAQHVNTGQPAPTISQLKAGRQPQQHVGRTQGCRAGPAQQHKGRLTRLMGATYSQLHTGKKEPSFLSFALQPGIYSVTCVSPAQGSSNSVGVS